MSTTSVMFTTIVLALAVSACSLSQCQSDSCASMTSATTPGDVSDAKVTVDDSAGIQEAATTYKARATENNRGVSTSEIQAEEAPETVAVKPVTNAEQVHSIAYDGVALTAKVISTGCTSAEDFEVRAEVRDGSCYLTLVRNKPDYCRRAPFVMDVVVPWSLSGDCSAMPVEFDNEIVDLQEKSAPPSLQRKLPEN